MTAPETAIRPLLVLVPIEAPMSAGLVSVNVDPSVSGLFVVARYYSDAPLPTVTGPPPRALALAALKSPALATLPPP